MSGGNGIRGVYVTRRTGERRSASGELRGLSSEADFIAAIRALARSRVRERVLLPPDTLAPGPPKDPDDDEDEDEAPETPTDEPPPIPVQDPPDQPDKAPYTVTGSS